MTLTKLSKHFPREKPTLWNGLRWKQGPWLTVCLCTIVGRLTDSGRTTLRLLLWRGHNRLVREAHHVLHDGGHPHVWVCRALFCWFLHRANIPCHQWLMTIINSM